MISLTAEGSAPAALRRAALEALQRGEAAAAIASVERLSALLSAAGGVPQAQARAQAELGDLWSVLTDHAAALRCYERAVELCPEQPLYWFNRAAIRRFVGDLAGAESDYDRVIALAPGDAQACLNRSELRVQTAQRNHIAELEDKLAGAMRSAAAARQQIPLRYALAKEYEDIAEFEASWRHLSAGSILRRRQLQYDPQIDLATVDWIRAAFPASAFAGSGCPSQEPIFILGMPRTGSTLLDRILGGHADVFSAGELPHFSLAVVAAVEQRLGARPTRQRLIAGAATVDFAALGADYLRRTRPRTGRTPHFTDKLPINYLYCGLIARALPNARIVHLTRHPMATCYSIYKVLFEQGYPFSYDLTELADYYAGYRRLMQHWEEAMPGRILTLAYEDLVADPAGQARRLLGQLGLAWQPGCIDFVNNAAPVATASASQVRRPLYDSSVALWRHYEQHLSPVYERLVRAGIRMD